MEQVKFNGKVIDIVSISSTNTEAFKNMRSILDRTSVVGLDAEWKPQKTSKPKTSAVGLDAEGKPQKTSEPKASMVGLDAEGKSDETRQSEFPQVCLVQIACLPNTGNPVVFLLDLWQLQFNPSSEIHEIHELLRGIFNSTKVKLGFQFKQDFIYISNTFQSHLKSQAFDQVDLYLDIFDIYNKILSMQGEETAKELKKLTVICEEIIGIPLSKEHQQKDWSERPLKIELMEYAAIDAYCLIELLDAYCRKFFKKGGMSCDVAEPGLPLSESSMNTIREISGEIVLKESDRQPRSRINNGGQSSAQPISRVPWDCSLGGDGRSKFLCDDKMLGLARLLRVAGIDTVIANQRDGYKSSSTVDLIKQAEEEGRVLLTECWTHACPNYHELKSRSKSHQLDEVLKAFGLEKNKDRKSRCTKCNIEFHLCCPLTPRETEEAATGYSIIGWCNNCRGLFERYLYKNSKGEWRFDEGDMAHVGIFPYS